MCFAPGREDRCIACAIRDKGFDVVHLFTTMSTNNSEETFPRSGPGLGGLGDGFALKYPPYAISYHSSLVTRSSMWQTEFFPYYAKCIQLQLNSEMASDFPSSPQPNREVIMEFASRFCIYRRVDVIIHSKPISRSLALGQTQIYCSGVLGRCNWRKRL